MAEATPELRALLNSAEQAASVQDFASAEQHLRQAASLQEAQLGPNHPDLANTLNNLGIVSERTGKSADAEACYRRAYAIARSSLPAEDPLVLTSGQNLRDFCAATGRPFEPVVAPPPLSAPAPAQPTPAAHVPAAPVPAPLVPAPPVAVAPVPAPLVPAPPAPAPPAPQAASPRAPSAQQEPAAPPVPFPSRSPVAPSQPARVERGKPVAQPTNVAPVAVPVESRAISQHPNAKWVVIGVGLLLALVIVLASRPPRSSEPVAPVATAETPSAEAPASEPPPAAATSVAPKAPPNTAPGKTSPQPSTIGAVKKPAATDTRSTTASGSASKTVSLVESRLCRSLENWRCTPATNPAGPGAFVFYTRVKSARDTTVRHRWYLNGTLRRSVDLRVAANPGDGYRTYSRNTVGADRRGNWTIELRDADGALLHEERFVVQ